MKKVKVIDSIMGSGKTEWAIAYMNANRHKRFIYITPFNDEIENRILPRCSGFVTGNTGSKFQDFKRLLRMGKNIAATHECFKMADEETRISSRPAGVQNVPGASQGQAPNDVRGMEASREGEVRRVALADHRECGRA